MIGITLSNSALASADTGLGGHEPARQLTHRTRAMHELGLIHRGSRHRCGWTMAALCASALLLVGADPAAADPPSAGDPAELLAHAIRIPTTEPSSTRDAERLLAQLYVDVLRGAGIEAELIETPPEADGSRRAAAYGRLRGRRDGGGLLLLSHLDVVPAEPALWSVDPFAGVRQGGEVIGRGALDAKGVSVVHIAALAHLAARASPPARDIVFLATPGEELGGVDGAGFIARSRPDLLKGVEFALTEGGGIHVAGSGPPVWGVSVTEKAPCWLGAEARGVPGHSSAPGGDSAVDRLIAALDRIRRVETPLRVVPAAARMFQALAPLAPPEDRAGYADLASALVDDAAFRRRFLSNPARAALVRDTIAITVLSGAPRTNVLPAVARASIDVRLLPGEECAKFREDLAIVADDANVALSTELTFEAAASSADTPLFRAIESLAAELEPGAHVVPRMIAGFTDAHWLRDAGIVTYGFVPRWLSADEARRIHGPGERISEANLDRGARALVRLVGILDGS